MSNEKLFKGASSNGRIVAVDNTARNIRRAVKKRRKEEGPVFKEMKVRR